MRLRTRLILALLLLSALPLAAVVLLNYVSAQRAVRETVQAEADQLTREMETHLANVRADVRRGMERLGSPLFLHYLEPQEGWLAVDDGLAGASPPAPAEAPLAPPLPELEGIADLLQTIEVEELLGNEPAQRSDGVGQRSDVIEQRTDEVESAARAWVLHAPLIRELALGGSRIGLAMARPFMPEEIQMNDETMAAMASDLGQLFDQAVRSATGDPEDREAQAEIEQRLQAIGQRFAARFGVEVENDGEPGARAQDASAQDASAQGASGEGAKAAEQAQGASARRPLPPQPPRPDSSVPSRSDRPAPPRPRLLLDLDTTVRDGDRVLGRLRPVLDPNAVLHRVMGPIDLQRGQIPFLLDGEGRLFVLEESHRPLLEELAVVSMVPPPPAPDGASPAENDAAQDDTFQDDTSQALEVRHQVSDDWVVVLSTRQPSGLFFGIASPVGESLAGVRAAAARNFAGGVGLLALAMVGILPLARRLTGDLEHLTKGVERIAAGDLETEVEVRSRDEIAQLAGAFNRMAHDLKVNQGKLVDQALKERLLAEELARKNQELEAAREFQLSMLPSELPDHAHYEVAVAMRTATEVGGDYYDFHLGEGEGGAPVPLTVAVGDATGHGATAGRMVTVVKSLFSASPDLDPAPFLADANRTVRRMHLGRMAMALVMARFEDDGVTIASAGMPPALVLRGNGRVDEVTLAGMPLGGIDLQYAAKRITLAAGDLVLFQSDGLPEQPDAAGDPLGYVAIRDHLTAQSDRAPQAIIDGLLELLDLWIEGGPPADDVTFVAIRRRR